MKIAVYCGADAGSNPKFTEAAGELGRWIGSKGYSLVYGGGESGLMGVVAKEVFACGMPVFGVVPEDVPFILSRPQPYVTDLIVTENMSTRKQKMLELADAFIALPGGVGTLDEITEVITLTKIGVFGKKSVLFNREDFYEPLRDLFINMDKAGFLKDESMKHVLFSDDVEEIERFLNE